MTQRYELGYVEAAARTLDPIQLRSAINTLTGKQRFVVELRFGLRDGVQYKLEEIAYYMGISHVAVLKIERRALENLREAIGD